MWVKKQQLELDMEQQTGSKSGKEYIKNVYCHPDYLTYAEYIMRNAGLDEAQAEVKIAWRSVNNLRWYHPYGRKRREVKVLLEEDERGEWKSWLKTNMQKTKIMSSGPISS